MESEILKSDIIYGDENKMNYQIHKDVFKYKMGNYLKMRELDVGSRNYNS